jgi:uncharacterized protein (DUF1778 family)
VEERFLLTDATHCNTLQHMKEKSLSLRLEKELREILEALAAKDRRTLSDYIRLALLEHVQNLYRASGKVFQEHTQTPRRAGKQ